jgi:hypothetical protein
MLILELSDRVGLLAKKALRVEFVETVKSPELQSYVVIQIFEDQGVAI